MSTKRYCKREYKCLANHTSYDWNWGELKVKCSAPKCKKSAYLALARSSNGKAPATVYFENPETGHLYTPAHSSKKVPDGYVRKEISSSRDYERFTRAYTSQLRREHELAQEAREDYERVMFDEPNRERRKALLEAMQSFSPEGKELARLAMEKSDREDRERYESSRKSYDPGFYIETRELDAQNRLPYNDEATDWKDKY